jgi:chromosome segregation ATPase
MAITRSDGFVDLRISPSVSGRSDEDSVWPSFTDIMTVVVLIFLVSLIVILMRNTELVQQLRDSMSQTETMSSQQSELEIRIATLGDSVTQLQAALERSEQAKSAAEQTATQRQQEILALLTDVADLTGVRELLTEEKANLTQQLDQVRAERQALGEDKAMLLETQQQMRSQIASLEKNIGALQGEVADLTRVRELLTEEKANLTQQLDQVRAERQALGEDKAMLLETQQQMRSQIASLEENKANLTEQLDQVQADRDGRQKQLAISEQQREALASNLDRVQQALIELQAEQARLISSLESQSAETLAMTQSRDELADQRQQLAKQVSSLDVMRVSLETEITALRTELASLVRASISNERALQASQLEGEALSAQLAETALEYRLTKEELAYLRAEYAEEVAKFGKERELLMMAHQQELDVLREQHSDLESKYNRLVRPARSTVGRFVVEVRFRKEGEARRYSIRPVAGGLEEEVSETDLHRRLTVLKAQHGDKLYTKVIIDDNSVTHGEAWSFTSKILNRYDYYYQN